MPAKHDINDQNKLLITAGIGEANDPDMIEAMVQYQKAFRNKPEYKDYREIVDFSSVTNVRITTKGLRRFVPPASQNDHEEIKKKLLMALILRWDINLPGCLKHTEVCFPETQKF